MTMLMGCETEFALIPRATPTNGGRPGDSSPTTAPSPSAPNPPSGSGGGGGIANGTTAPERPQRYATDHTLIGQQIIALAPDAIEALPSGDTGYFLATGSRLYLDPTGHVELATAECHDPASAACSLIAGERLCLQLVETYNRAQPGRQWNLFAHNVDLIGNSSWGAHESYSFQDCTLDHLGRHLLPHLISRPIYTGAGGLDPRAGAARFMISPRARFFTETFGGSTTGARAIFNNRQEHHAANCQRLHVITGESVRSPRALLLKIGVTALLTHLIDRGLIHCVPLTPRDPVGAFQAFAGDPSLAVTVPLIDGSQRTALDIQMQCLQAAEAVKGKHGLPEWMPDILVLWRQTLEGLRSNTLPPDAADWLMRRRVFEQACRQRGQTLEALAQQSVLLQALDHCLPGRWTAPALARQLQSDGASRVGEAMTKVCTVHGVEPRAVMPWLELRDQLITLDVRFGQVGGPWSELMQKFNGHTPGMSEARVRELSRQAPAGRAARRGRWIRRLARRNTGQGQDYTADWSRIVDEGGQRWLDLSDAFDHKPPRWRRMTIMDHAPEQDSGSRIAAQRVEEIKRHYQSGDFREALRLARLCQTMTPPLPSDQAARVPRFIAWCSARLGDWGNAVEMMRSAGQRDEGPYAENYAFVYRYAGLIPRNPEMSQSLARAVEHAGGAQASGSLIKELLGVQALDQDPATARTWLQAALPLAPEPRIRARILGPLADACRRLNDAAAARACIDEALRIQRGRFLADMAEFTLAALAKLDPDRRAAALDEADAIQRQLGHPIGRARTVLLRASGCRDAAQAQRLHDTLIELQRHAPLLAQCPRFSEILRDWSQWTSDDQPRHGDAFWGV